MATPLLGDLDDDLFGVIEFQQPNPDTVELDWPYLNYPSENIHDITTDANLDLGFPLGEYTDGLSFGIPVIEETDSFFPENSEFVTWPDSSASGFSINHAGYDAALDSTFYANVNKLGGPTPACSSLPRQEISRDFLALCCESPCHEIQTWRNKCLRCINALASCFRIFLLNYFSRGSQLSSGESCLLSNIQCKCPFPSPKAIDSPRVDVPARY
jgi:hypothetical protein